IDMLCDKREFSTAKQAQSAVHQYGREGLLSELYGVTNWDFDFRGHKLQGDWQAALGVTLRVHHLTWVSMAGEAKRDYPACIGYQSPWYKEYAYVEDHFARLNTALVRGIPVVRVAVIHPVEGYWMHFGPNDKTAGIRAEMEADFENIINWLLLGQIDFDFVAESLLPDLYTDSKDAPHKFNVGLMAYDVVLVPNCRALRGTTLALLEKFQARGGKVVLAGEPAGIVDGECSSKAVNVLAGCTRVPFSRTAVLGALEDYREVSAWRENGSPANWFIYQLRQDGPDRWLFICNGTKPTNHDLPYSENITFRINGEYTPVLYNTLDGSISPLSAEYRDGETIIQRRMHMHDSLLLKLEPLATKSKPCVTQPAKPQVKHGYNSSAKSQMLTPHGFMLHEPNVLVLDIAEYSTNGGKWQPQDEVLRIDNKFREELGYPLRMQSLAQPWTLEKQAASGNVLRLRYSINSQIALTDIRLALEGYENTTILWNGKKVAAATDGCYVDRAIKTVPLPGLKAGSNELILEIPFEKRTNVENCFLLGQFGVELSGRHATITAYPEVLNFGDVRFMGLPFYGGNISYKCKVYSHGGEARISATYFKSPLLAVNINGKRVGRIAYAPYSLDLSELPEGWHDVEIVAYGNRLNTFGSLHNANETLAWHGPDSWRTTGAAWCYEYRTKANGVLKSPEFVSYGG
ncbi:MAG: hypothetical protein FWC92_08560, partial [Defluviitaleaceae bacterium]|nr:hypothetical protein [Defluviitaleaceae bacterium]